MLLDFLMLLGRRAYDRADADWYVDSPECTTALLDRVPFTGEIVDPCCGQGSVLVAARRAGLRARGSDIVQRAHGRWPGADAIADFLESDERVDNIVTNPPYGDTARQVLDRALRLARRNVALLLPLRWLAGTDRAETLYAVQRPDLVLVLRPRPSMPPGEALKAGLVDARGGKVDYAWFVWWCSAPSGVTVVDWIEQRKAGDLSGAGLCSEGGNRPRTAETAEAAGPFFNLLRSVREDTRRRNERPRS